MAEKKEEGMKGWKADKGRFVKMAQFAQYGEMEIAVSEGFGERGKRTFLQIKNSGEKAGVEGGMMAVFNNEIVKLADAARAADPRISDVMEFDFYENSIAFQITIEPDRNLTDADLSDIQNRVVAAVEKLGPSLRTA